MNNVTINIAKDYTTTPGARYKMDGPFSGEEFREIYLEKHFKNPTDCYKVKIILDGTEGYATSFLEEAFGGLVRKIKSKKPLERIEFISIEDPLLIDEIKTYIENADA